METTDLRIPCFLSRFRSTTLVIVASLMCGLYSFACGQDQRAHHDSSTQLLKFYRGYSETEVALVEFVSRGKITWRSRYCEGICLLSLDEDNSEPVRDLIQNLRFIELAEFNGIVQPLSGPCSAPITPNDSLYSQQWAINNTGQFGGTSGSDTHVDCAWTVTTGTNELVAVLDNGLNCNFAGPEFNGQLWTNSAEQSGIPGLDDDLNGYVDDIHGWNFNADDEDIFSGGSFHGAACAGLIVAKQNNGQGVSGVAPGCKLMVLKTAGGPFQNPATVDMYLKAAEYAAMMGVRTLSISQRYYDWSQIWYEHTDKMGRSAGVLFVVGAGNEDKDLNQYFGTGFVPASFGCTLSNVVTVAGVYTKDQLCDVSICGYASNYGSNCVLLGAPGGDLWTTNADGGGSPAYQLFGGTSGATPIFAGIAAMVRATHPTWTPAQVRDRLRTSARPISSLQTTTISGGVVDAWAAIQP